MSVIGAVKHQYSGKLPGSPEEKRDIVDNIVFIVRTMNSYHFLQRELTTSDVLAVSFLTFLWQRV